MFAHQLVEIEFLLTTNWNVFDGQNKFIVLNPTTALGEMRLDRKEYAYSISFAQEWGDVMTGRISRDSQDQSFDCRGMMFKPWIT